MKKAFEVDRLRWVAYEEFVACNGSDSEEDDVKANDKTDSSEENSKASESATDYEEDEGDKTQINKFENIFS